MALEVSWFTKHERGVMIAALADYRSQRTKTNRTAATARARAQAGADAFVASDLIRQLTDR